MLLPSRLSRTTLGDLLGRLHRSRMTGALELAAGGRKHRIHLERGAVVAVVLDLDAPPRDVRHAIERIFQLLDDTHAGEASIKFHVGVAAKIDGDVKQPLDPREFLHGRRRARDRTHRADTNGEITTYEVSPARARACRLLGVPLDADASTIRRAFRAAAARVHPDRFAALPSHERQRLHVALAELSAAYHLLVA